VAGDQSIRRIAAVDHRTLLRDAVEASQVSAQFDAPRAGRHCRCLELHLGRRDCRSDPGATGVPAVADVRSLMGVGRTA
jgi:hypothetical protein